MHRKKINISTVMAGQKLGIKEVDEAIWLVSFMHYGIHRSGAENLANHRQPVRLEVVTHVLGTFCHPCLRAGHSTLARKERNRTLDRTIMPNTRH
jgi:hypothetical protein